MCRFALVSCECGAAHRCNILLIVRPPPDVLTIINIVAKLLANQVHVRLTPPGECQAS
jgi:hypothetical protein